MLGVVEGLTEFLPVSSTGHLTVTERLFNLKIDDKAVTAFTAVIQFGAIIAVLHLLPARHLAADRGRDHGHPRSGAPLGTRGPRSRVRRHRHDPDRDRRPRRQASRSKDRCATSASSRRPHRLVGRACSSPNGARAQNRDERDLTLRDAVVMGVMQCFALVPGVSRSGATISAGLFRGIDRVSATRLSFFLAIPALTAATVLELPKALRHGGVGAGNDAGRHGDRVRRRLRVGRLAAALRLRTQDQRVRPVPGAGRNRHPHPARRRHALAHFRSPRVDRTR